MFTADCVVGICSEYTVTSGGDAERIALRSDSSPFELSLRREPFEHAMAKLALIATPCDAEPDVFLAWQRIRIESPAGCQVVVLELVSKIPPTREPYYEAARFLLLRMGLEFCALRAGQQLSLGEIQQAYADCQGYGTAW